LNANVSYQLLDLERERDAVRVRGPDLDRPIAGRQIDVEALLRRLGALVEHRAVAERHP